MAKIPTWLLGKHATTINIIPQTVAADGTLTAGTSAPLIGYLDSIEYNLTPETEDIQAMDKRAGNKVIVTDTFGIVLTEILKTNDVGATPTNILANLASLGDYFSFVCTRGGRTFTFFGLRGAYKENINRGKSTGALNIDYVDAGVTNPTYV